MSRYISDIIKYFSTHQTSKSLQEKVQRRLAQTADDEACDAAYRELWNETDATGMSDEQVDKAWQRTESVLFGRHQARGRLDWMRMAAIWLVPILLLGAATYVYFSAGEKVAYYETVDYVHHFTTYGKCDEVTLPDGSKVWMNGGSLLIYPSHFPRNERKVCLAGEAYFEVAKDAERPFFIDINQLQLKVLGTTFNVSGYPEDPEMTTTLKTGKVEVTVNQTEKSYILNPGNQLVYHVKSGQVDIHEVNVDDYCKWRSGAVYINDLGLMETAKILERSYNVKIHILSSKYQHHKLRVHFDSKDSIEHVLEIMKMLIPELSYDIKDKEIYIR